nr:hypothetical protein TetV2_00370 [Oceanusvirus sp.]
MAPTQDLRPAEMVDQSHARQEKGPVRIEGSAAKIQHAAPRRKQPSSSRKNRLKNASTWIRIHRCPPLFKNKKSISLGVVSALKMPTQWREVQCEITCDM